MKQLGYINGMLMPVEEMKVSAMDRGYYFGDGVYEVTRVHKGRCFALSYHEDRLYRSMREMEIPVRIPPDELSEMHEIMIEQSGIQDGYIYIQITRGTAPRHHGYGKMRLDPNVMMYITELPDEELKPIEAAKAISLEDMRWKRCDIKSLNLLPNTMAQTKAEKKGAYTAILFRDNICMEGACSNVFAVKDGILYTRPADNLILKGITRQLILTRVAPTCGVTAIEREFDKDFVLDADELMFTDSVGGIVPIVELDGQPVGTGTIGKVTKRLQEAYINLMDEGLA